MADRQTCRRAVTAAATAGLEMEAGKEGGRREEGRVERRQRQRGEGPPCLHFVWNEEQDEGCVKDTEVEWCCLLLFVYVCVCPPIYVDIYLY